MKFFCFEIGVTADAAAPLQRQRHRQGRDTTSHQLWRRRSSLVHASVGIFLMLWSTPSIPSQIADGGSQGSASWFRMYAYAAPAGAVVSAKTSLAANSRRSRTPVSSGASRREAELFQSEEYHSLLDHSLQEAVQKRPVNVGPVIDSSVTSSKEEIFTGLRQPVVEQTSAAANNVLQETRRTHGKKQMYAKRMDPSAFIQEHMEHGQQATGSKSVDCSCEIAGNCLPKGSCVAIACVLVAFSIVTVFLLAWLLQWLSAIPSEWVLAKRLRRRSLNFFSRKTTTDDKKGNEPHHPLSTAVTQGGQQPQRSLRGGTASPDEPLLEEHQTEAVDSVQGERGIQEQYENHATSVPKTENGRL